MSAPRSPLSITVHGVADPAAALAVTDALRFVVDAYRRTGQPVPWWLAPLPQVYSAAPVPADVRHVPPTLDRETGDAERRAGQHDLVDYGEAARRLKVSRRTVERLVSTGEIPHRRVRGCVRFRPSDLRGYAARNT